MNRLITITFLFLSFFFFAQQGDGGKPKGSKAISLKTIDKRVFFEPNIEQLRAEDILNDEAGTGPWRFGFNNNTSLNTANSGTWVTLLNGDKIWFLQVECTNALTVNLTFSDTKIPEGNELYIYNPTKDFILGKFTSYHLYDGQLGAELIPGSVAIVEYFVPKNNPEGQINVCTVTHGYRTAAEFQQKAFGSSGSCNRNVNCTEGASWTNQRNGVVMLVSGSSGFCSGSLINNTQNDGKPYILTADHCFTNPTSWIFRFQWQSPDCNNPSASPSFQSLSGAVLRARATASDFCLVEITGGLIGGTVPVTYTPYFSGWDNSGVTPLSAAGIHHPSGDIKKISIENEPLISTTFGSCPANSHWGVTQWDSGVTEGGSSGSPLFDQNHRIIGQLHGGASACGASALSDEYGKVSVSWNPSGSDSTNQLKYWLDPQNSGAQFMDGYDPSGAVPVQLDAGITNPQGVSGRICSGDIQPKITITNSGAQTLTSANILYSFDAGAQQTFAWTGSIPQWQSAFITLPVTALSGGTHSFSASVDNPNASIDEYVGNNNTASSFDVVINGASVQLNLTLDCYGSETSWELQDSTGTAIYFASGYSDDTPGLVQDSWCLNSGCYSFIIMDSYNDGLTGDTSCSPDGSVDILFAGSSLAAIPQDSADFGSQTQLNFCVNSGGIEILSENQVLIYPNPANDFFTVCFQNNSNTKVELVDLFGKTLKTVDATSNQAIFQTHDFAAGTYLIRVLLNGQQIISKVVIN